MTTHDTTRLQALGKRRQRLAAQLAELDNELEPEIYAAAQAGVPQVEIIRWTGMARESIRLKSMTPEERESERQKRRKGAPGE
jgi:hypothetical protein